MGKIKKILIANRGEIALRVIQTAREMGIKTVTLYTDEEVSLPHKSAGDESLEEQSRHGLQLKSF